PGHALVADDDQVGLELLGDVEDRVRRVALAGVRLHLHPGLLRGTGRGVQGGVDVLARADGVGDVPGDLAALLAQPGLGHGLVSADDVELGAAELGELDRLPDGLCSRVGAVGAYNDSLEQVGSPNSLVPAYRAVPASRAYYPGP